MTALWKLWEKVPELRLGQLLENTRRDEQLGKDLFYVEDVDLVMAVEKYISGQSINETHDGAQT